MRDRQVRPAEGELVMSSDVVGAIVASEASKADGVVTLGDTAVEEIESLLSRGSLPKGVAVQSAQGEVAATLKIRVEYGTKIPDLANSIRTKIADAIRAITGYTVRSINITVDRMELPE